jgi:delta 1-pyrroline-5-carboxylate dehydrogenase
LKPQVYTALANIRFTARKEYSVMEPMVENQNAISKETEAVLDWTTFHNIIGGEYHHPTKETRATANPATGELLPPSPVSTQRDVDDAIDGARDAFPSWSMKPMEERKAALLAFANAIEAHMSEFVNMIIAEQGKPVRINFILPEAFRLMITS